MLIYVFPTSYPNPDNPVANSFIKDQVYALSQKDGVETVVLNVIKQPSRFFFKKIDKGVEKTIEDTGVVYRIKCKTLFERTLPSINQLVFNHNMKRLYKHAVSELGKPDVVYAHFYRAALSAMKATNCSDVPIVVMEHSGELMKTRISSLEKRVLKKVVMKSSAYITNTEKLKEMVLLHTGLKKRVFVIPNIVDDMFTFSNPKMSEDFVFLAVGRLTYDKRFDLLIDAFCSAFNKLDNVRLVIGGQGPEYNNLVKKVVERQRNDQITFLGQLSREKVLSEMIDCSCFVLPSRHETFGIVWREALCVGRPVITTDHGGFSNSDWNDSYGIMVGVDNQSALENAMRKMVEDYNKYDLVEISRENCNMYSGKCISSKLLGVFENCVRGADSE